MCKRIFCCCCGSESGDFDNEPSGKHVNKAFEDEPRAEQPRYVPNPVELRQMPPKSETGTHIALYDYQARQDGDLSFQKGELFIVLESTGNPDWWLLKSMRTYDQGYGPSNFIAPIGTSEQEEWYAGKTTRQEAQRRILQPGNVKGAFLIRESESKPGNFSLDVLDVGQADRRIVKRYMIRKTDDGRLYINSRAQFASLMDLVHYYSKEETVLCCKLERACPVVEEPRPMSIARDVFELQRSSLDLKHEIGTGAFGKVHRGTWNKTTEVAIKTLKPGTMSPEAFLKEAEAMKRLRHANLVTLYGVVSEDPIYIVTEYMMHGSLLEYLRKGKGKVTEIAEHIDMAGQIVAGMAHIESMSYVHRDLRAANVLVGRRGVCKVADFGLARLIEDEEYQAGAGAKFPIMWTAPEALTHLNFTIKSDVWSFGIVLMEIVTRGAVPYVGMTGFEVSQQVSNGFRMTKPRYCSDEIYEIMTRCWRMEPSERPSFFHLKEELENLTKDYEDFNS